MGWDGISWGPFGIWFRECGHLFLCPGRPHVLVSRCGKAPWRPGQSLAPPEAPLLTPGLPREPGSGAAADLGAAAGGQSPGVTAEEGLSGLQPHEGHRRTPAPLWSRVCQEDQSPLRGVDYTHSCLNAPGAVPEAGTQSLAC